jgi:pyridoxamine 5'-phosphate oxidase family protein
MASTRFTDAETEYLNGQRLGRLATVSPDGTPQNNPVGFTLKHELGTIDVFGLNLAASRKFRNVAVSGRAAIVVDDVVSLDPWQVRGVEVRGTAEALDGVDPPIAQQSRQVIRIHPRRIISWNVDPALDGMQARNVTDDRSAA